MPVGMEVCDVAVERTVHVDIAGGMAMAVSDVDVAVDTGADVDVAVDAAADVGVNDCDVDSDRITSNIWLSSSHEGSLLGDFACALNRLLNYTSCIKKQLFFICLLICIHNKKMFSLQATYS